MRERKNEERRGKERKLLTCRQTRVPAVTVSAAVRWGRSPVGAARFASVITLATTCATVVNAHVSVRAHTDPVGALNGTVIAAADAARVVAARAFWPYG